MAMLEQRIQQQFFDSADLQYQTAESLARPISEAVTAVVGAITAGGKIMFCGQDGGEALAAHAVAAFVGCFERERPPLAALALRPEPRELQALGLPGDLLVLLDPAARSTEATLAMVRAAHGKDMSVVMIAGQDAGALRETLSETDVLVAVPHERMARVLETHLLVLHALCDAVDMQLMGEQDL